MHVQLAYVEFNAGLHLSVQNDIIFMGHSVYFHLLDFLRISKKWGHLHCRWHPYGRPKRAQSHCGYTTI